MALVVCRTCGAQYQDWGKCGECERRNKVGADIRRTADAAEAMSAANQAQAQAVALRARSDARDAHLGQLERAELNVEDTSLPLGPRITALHVVHGLATGSLPAEAGVRSMAAGIIERLTRRDDLPPALRDEAVRLHDELARSARVGKGITWSSLGPAGKVVVVVGFILGLPFVLLMVSAVVYVLSFRH